MPENQSIRDRVESALGERVVSTVPLSGGCVADVWRADLKDGRRLVIKSGGGGGFEVEAAMLEHLGATSRLPVPKVRHAEPSMLVMDWIEHDGRVGAAGEAELGSLLASMHITPVETFGWHANTRIGPLDQPNIETGDWVGFFAEYRLVHFGELAHASGGIDGRTMRRVIAVADRAGEWIDRGVSPALIHGDLWSGNVLWNAGNLSGVIDPAVYHADPEVELAFMTLFGTPSEAFWQAYRQVRPERGGESDRWNCYNLFPLLVHARLFGGSYGDSVRSRLDALGC